MKPIEALTYSEFITGLSTMDLLKTMTMDWDQVELYAKSMEVKITNINELKVRAPRRKNGKEAR